MSEEIPSAEELAKKGERKRKKKEAKKAKLQAISTEKNKRFQRILDQKRIFKHISAWQGWAIVFIWFAVLSLFTVIPMLLLYSYSDNMTLTTELWIGLLSPFIGFITLYIISRYLLKKKVMKEKQWIDALPFPLEGYPDFFVYRSYPSFDVSLVFERKVPSNEFILNILATTRNDIVQDKSARRKPKSFKPESEKEKAILETLAADFDDSDQKNPQVFKFTVGNNSASKFDRHRRWAKRCVHSSIDTQILAIHKQYPIKSVIIGNGTKELDFEWWIPLRQKGFLFLQ